MPSFSIGGFANGVASGVMEARDREERQKRDSREAERLAMDKTRFERETTRQDRQEGTYKQLADLVETFAGSAAPNADQFSPRTAAMDGINVPAESYPVAAPAPVESQPLEGTESQPAAAPAPGAGADPGRNSQIRSGLGEAAGRATAPPVKGPQTDSDRIGYGLYRQPALFSNPEFLNKASQIFLKAGRPEGVAWLERSSKAEQEGGVTAIKKLLAGDPRGAEQAFNSTGNQRIVPGSLVEVESGKWQATDASGQTRVIEPQKMLRSLLSPHDYFAVETKNAEIQSHDQQRKDTAAYQNRVAGETVRHNKAVEGIQGQLADWKQNRGTESQSAMIQNMDYLVKNGVAKNPAEAFTKLRTAMEKPEDDAVLSVATTLLRGSGYIGKDGASKAMRDAQSMVRGLKGGGPAVTFKSADDVKAALRAGRIDRGTAIKELGAFGYAPQ